MRAIPEKNLCVDREVRRCAVQTAIRIVHDGSTADITAAHLLSPPGGGSLPLALFKIMANAPEALVGALSLIYVGGAALTLTIGIFIYHLFKKHLTH